MFFLIILCLGLALGSFLNVVISRLPEKKSILFPPSHCPNCKTRIKWYHNIPVISYVFLRGKCAYCGWRIPLRYPVVEILTPLLLVSAYVKFSPLVSPAVFFWAISFVLFLIPVAFIDLEKKIIPDSLSLGLLFLGWLFALLKANPFFSFKHSLISGLSGIGLLFLVNELYYLVSQRDGMGMGDFKLMGAIGAYLGYESFYSVILIASLSGIAVFLILFLYKRLFQKVSKTSADFMKSEIPFGPFLCLGALLYFYDILRLNPF